jgi:PAS domain S-box-containing protein/putative nucleotidyltransferase with HDIG domain
MDGATDFDLPDGGPGRPPRGRPLRAGRALAQLGRLSRLALEGASEAELLDAAAHAVTDVLEVGMAKYLELDRGRDAFVLRAAVGWPDGLVGVAEVPASGDRSYAAFVTAAGQPVFVRDLRSESRFAPSPLLTELGVLSAINVVVHGPKSEALGVLGAQSRTVREFTDDDAAALQAIADVVSVGVLRRRSEGRLGALLQNCSDLIVVVDVRGQLVYANPAAEAMFGFGPQDLGTRSLLDLVHPDERDRALAAFRRDVSQPGVRPPTVSRLKAASGEWRYIETVPTNCLGDPAVAGVVLNSRDVTERMNLTRVLRTLSAGNRALVSAADEASLVAEVCRTVVDVGGFPLAWVGYVEHDEACSVRPVAVAGQSGFMEGIQVSWADDDYGRGQTGTAVRTRRAQVVDDLSYVPMSTEWRAATAKFGLRSGCALPLQLDGEVLGALSIYAGEPGAFGPSEVDLLSELAEDLSYGIGRARDAVSLHASEERFRTLADEAPIGIMETSRDGVVQYANAKMQEITGQPVEVLVAQSWLTPVHAEDSDQVLALVDKVQLRQKATASYRLLRPDGEARPVRVLVAPKGGHPDGGFIVAVEDVTAEVQAERAAEERAHFLEELLRAIPVPVYYLDATRHFLGYNPAYGALLGRSRDEIVGKTVFDTRPAELAERFDATDRELLAHPGMASEEEVELAGPDGAPRSVLVHKAVFSDVAGRPAGIVGVNFDLTGIRRAEQEQASAAERLELTLAGAVAALSATTELRDPYTAGHQRRVAELACAIAGELGWDDARTELLRTASVLHDIGKIVVPAEILSKPGHLSVIEMAIISQHAAAGADIVGPIGFDPDVAEIIRQHHERLDGSGYPSGLGGDEILPGALVLSVADVVEAMISHRPYRPALPIEAAVTELEDGAGTRYQASACRAAISLLCEQGFTFAQ